MQRALAVGGRAGGRASVRSQWRQSVLQGRSLQDRKAEYDQAWRRVEEQRGSTPRLGYDDIPWPSKADALAADDVCGMLLCGVDAAHAKQALREEVKRWHPDKFQSKLGSRLEEADRERILARVNEVSNIINTGFSRAKAAGEGQGR